MWRLFPVLCAFWTPVVLALLVNVAAALAYEWLRGGALDLLFRFWPVAPAGTLLLAVATWLSWRDWQQHSHRAEFAFIGPARKLRPEDLGFRPVQPGELLDPAGVGRSTSTTPRAALYPMTSRRPRPATKS
ncbi:MAG: hypothetical protein HYU88_08255, partial [Chloroflexi bacterium]|nr:hypothetical protein [Chloroflexota bacterium]